MTTLDDKLLGEKTHYYCDSSDDEDGGKGSSTVQAPPSDDFRVTSLENGTTLSIPDRKGVIKDFQRYKQFENEQRESQDAEKLALMKKLSLSCRSYIDEKVEQKLNAGEEDLGDDADDNDPFIKEYIAKRMREMLERYQQREVKKVFGDLAFLNTGEALLSILEDKDLKNILVVTHVYNRKIPECKTMNSCLDKLAKKYQHVKFCCLDASVAGMSYELKTGYQRYSSTRTETLVGNFVSLGDEFGEKFDEGDVEDFLVENNILVSSQLISSISYNSNLSSIPKETST
ncbi:hypothetical protein TYRP_010948 [Tyrophagus putrescentiae]|nr:hypothetical protein TYRP_010948 [Tyrophagus putrescentiae]